PRDCRQSVRACLTGCGKMSKLTTQAVDARAVAEPSSGHRDRPHRAAAPQMPGRPSAQARPEEATRSVVGAALGDFLALFLVAPVVEAILLRLIDLPLRVPAASTHGKSPHEDQGNMK